MGQTVVLRRRDGFDDALSRLIESWSDGQTVSDVAPALSCREADNWADFLYHAGHVKGAVDWLTEHAASDHEEDDCHHGWDRQTVESELEWRNCTPVVVQRKTWGQRIRGFLRQLR